MCNQIMGYLDKLQKINALNACFRQSCHSLFLRKLKHISLFSFTFLTISVFLFCDIALASTTNILMLKSSDDPVYNKVANAAMQRLEIVCANRTSTCRAPSVSVETVGNESDSGLMTDGRWDLIVTIGTKAANIVSSSSANTPTLYALIPSNSLVNIRKNSNNSHTSAIFIDQPVSRQLALVKAVMPERRNVGVILGKYSSIGRSRLERLMHSMNFNPSISHASPENISRIIEGEFQRINVLLALPDPSIYNKQTVLTILLSSYRHRVPIIGYSAAFVKSGAIAAVYSTPRDIGQHIGDEIATFTSSTSRKLSSPAYPRYFSINVNQSVANSLNIRMPTISTIKSRLLQATQ